jgi:hypothetical protein
MIVRFMILPNCMYCVYWISMCFVPESECMVEFCVWCVIVNTVFGGFMYSVRLYSAVSQV